MTARTARERVRAELTNEIKDAARAELAGSGSSGLSLRAVARRLDMVPSALYRYFDGRDALLTALIVDAYDALGAAAEDADPGGPPSARWLAVGVAVRAWAWTHPHEWALLYGSPVPGYQAPPDTIPAAMRLVQVLIGILTDAWGSGTAPPLPIRVPVSAELGAWLGIVRDPYLVGLPDELAALALGAYTQLLGSVSIELFGQYGPDASPAPAIFEHALRVAALLLGLGDPG